MPRTYVVYILASDSRQLYVGVTGNLAMRLAQHRSGQDLSGYTTKHSIRYLVYCESSDDVMAAIRREKQIKVWTRRKKVRLIESLNPDWRDLSEGR
jgi:putative endonuclease